MQPPPGTSRLAWRLYAPIATLIGMASLVVLCVAWTPFALLGQWLLPQRRAVRMGRRAIHVCFRLYTGILQRLCGCRFDLQDLDALAASPGSAVVVANHPSLLDAVLIVSRLPNAVCIMKGSLARNVLLGAGARMAGYIVNDSALTVVRRGVEALQSQPTKLVIFPEGSRTNHPPLDLCQSTAGVIAARAQVPVAVMSIRFNSPYLGKDLPWFRPAQLPLTVQIQQVGQMVVDRHSAHAFGDTIARVLRAALLKNDSC